MHVLLAGGTGLIGRKLEKSLTDKGIQVSVLSRNPKRPNEYKWDPSKKEISFQDLHQVQVLINLSGAGIADKRWSEARKKELYDSRIGTNEFLYSLVEKMPSLKQFISSSGINCYGYEDDRRVYSEDDPFGKDYLSELVRSWEESADLFSSHVRVAKVRTAVVLDNTGGVLQKMCAVVKMGIGSPIGSGKQLMPWIHKEDLVNLIIHVMENNLEGAFNAVAGCDSNANFMHSIARTMHKPFFFPKVPSFIMKLLYGEMSSVLLLGLNASNDKIVESGFVFRYMEIESALEDLLT
jgi:uncharacterized protein (TIGR01777 family)